MNDVDVKIVISALQDDSYTVRKAALEIIRNDSKLSEMEIFDSYLLKMSDGNAKKEINSVIKILVKKSLENQEI